MTRSVRHSGCHLLVWRSAHPGGVVPVSEELMNVARATSQDMRLMTARTIAGIMTGPRQALASASAPAEQHHEDGLADDPQVPAQRPVRDVIQVEPDHLFVIQVAPPADLPGARQPGQHLEATHVAPRVHGPQPIAVAEAEGDAGRPGSSRLSAR